MRIPYDPSKMTPGVIQRPRVNAAAAVAELGSEARTYGAIAQLGQQFTAIGVDAAQAKRDKETRAAMGAFDAELQRAATRASIELGNIPKADGVDFQAQADDIYTRHFDALQDWINAPGNVPHSNEVEHFQTRLRMAGEQARGEMLKYENRYKKELAIDRGKRMIDTGIISGDKSMIEKGYFVRHEAGELTQDAAEVAAEKAVLTMYQGQDKRILEDAKNRLINGDRKGFGDTIDQMHLPTEKEKAAIKRSTISALQFESFEKMVQEAEGLQDLRELRQEALDFKQWDGSKSHLLQIEQRINAKQRRIEQAHLTNRQRFAREAAKGAFDAVAFDGAINDTERGIGLDGVDALRSTLEASARAWIDDKEITAATAQIKSAKPYKQMADKVAAALIYPQKAKIESLLESIEDKEFHPSVASELIADVLQAAEAKYSTAEEVDTNWLWGLGGRDVSEMEKRALLEYNRQWRELIDISDDVPANLHDYYSGGVRQIRDGVDKGGNIKLGVLEEASRVVKDLILRETALKR